MLDRRYTPEKLNSKAAVRIEETLAPLKLISLGKLIIDSGSKIKIIFHVKNDENAKIIIISICLIIKERYPDIVKIWNFNGEFPEFYKTNEDGYLIVPIELIVL